MNALVPVFQSTADVHMGGFREERSHARVNITTFWEQYKAGTLTENEKRKGIFLYHLRLL